MAVYKVPQDVEADDKLIGPFSFRQFVYLIIVAMLGALAWGLSNIFIGLAVIPLPFILLFGALALPLRKDQPMEIYLAAIISYYLKPHKRLWDPEGVESLIEITVPKIVEVQRTKDITQADAEQRFSYLANIVDSQGWAIRGVGVQGGTAMNTDVFLEAQGAQDVLDTSNSIAQSFDMMMTKSTEKMREEAVERMRQTVADPTPPNPFMPTPAVEPPSPYAGMPVIQPLSQQQPAPNAYAMPAQAPAAATPPVNPVVMPQTPVYNPYPTSMEQTVIQPVGDAAHTFVEPVAQTDQQTPPTTSDNVVSADIMNLANNPDLSIETIAHEAHRIQERDGGDSDEVVISLR